MKKVLSLLFAVVLMATLIPTAFAAEVVDIGDGTEGGEELEYINGTTTDGRVTYAIVGMIDGELSSEVMLYLDADCSTTVCPLNEYGELLFVVELDEVGGDGEKVLAVYTMDGTLVGYVKMRYIAPLTDLALLDVMVPYGALVGMGAIPPVGPGPDEDTPHNASVSGSDSESGNSNTGGGTNTGDPDADKVKITMHAAHGSDAFTADSDYISGVMGFEISFDKDLEFSYSDGKFSYLLVLEYKVTVTEEGKEAYEATFIRYGFEWPGVLNGCENGELNGTKYPDYNGGKYLDHLEANTHVRSSETIGHVPTSGGISDRNMELFDLLIANAEGENTLEITLTGTLYKDATFELDTEDPLNVIVTVTGEKVGELEGVVPIIFANGLDSYEDDETGAEVPIDGQFGLKYPVNEEPEEQGEQGEQGEPKE